ncbi:MAG TPA: M1 family aminopeptidase [Gemmatimonadaceae bacterium]|nr:M1 family aminopeptidase [Gemmatimonadaceae bacterium]
MTVLAAAAPPSAGAAVVPPGHATDSTALFMQPGVSHVLAEHRAAQIRNVAYAIALDVTAHDSATGHVAIRFERVRPGDVILDFRGLHLGNVRINGAPAGTLDANGAHIRLPDRALRDGSNVVELDFAARIAPAGASIIRYHDATDGNDYLYTLLVPADANALFPCFDQPDLKARVTLQLTVPRAWTALANGRVAGADTLAGHIRYRFAETKPLSTYLIAFAAGPWTRFSSTVAGHEVALYVRASRAHEVDADTLLALNARALDWLEHYFARPYPFDKFAMLLAPAFPFGGMEHPGAIFYNEDRFIFRERPTLPRILGREATIFHEVAHQWFGDLVTMRWFDDLWLKEGFATYMAAKMQDALDARANAWKTFYLSNKPLAYSVDASAGTTPIWQALDNLDQAKSNYGAIVYNKAPGVLSQLEYLVGDAAFRAGLQAFLAAHAYGNATWRDLLDAVGRAAHLSLDAWGAQYILRPGLPVFEQHLDVRDGRIARLAIVQHPARSLSGSGTWPARLEVLLAYDSAPPVRIPVRVQAETTVVAAATGRGAPAFVYVNAGDHGYGLVQLDPRSIAWLEQHIGSVHDDFLRAMLWGSMWDLVRDARLAPARFIAMALRELPHERDEQITAGLLGRLTRATAAYTSDAQRAELLPRVERALWEGASDTARGYGERKAHLDALIDVAASPIMLARVDSLLDADSAAGAPLRAPTRWAIITTLSERGAPTADARFAAESARDSTSEGKRLAFVAGAAHADAAVKREYFIRYFADSTLNEDWATASLRAFNALSQSALTLPYVTPALDSLPWIQRNRRIFFLGSWLGAFLGGQTSPEALARVNRFLDAHPDLPQDLRLKVLQAADELGRTVRIRSTFAASPAASSQ